MRRSLRQLLMQSAGRPVWIHPAKNSCVILLKPSLTWSGRLHNADRYKRLLLGRKAVGKSFLLQELQAAAATHLRDRNLKCVKIDCSSVGSASCLVGAIAQQIGGRCNVIDTWNRLRGQRLHERREQLELWLQKHRVYVFCVIDELQHVFMAACPHGGSIVDELSGFGSSKSGVIHWVLNGSSADLRELFTGRYPYPAPNYPRYCKRDLNDTKFVPMTIAPFLEANDFRELVAFHATHLSRATPPSDAEVSQLYLATGGLPGAVHECLMHTVPRVSAYATSAKGLGAAGSADVSSLILRAIANTLDGLLAVREDASDLDTYSRWTQWLDYRTLEANVKALATAASVPLPSAAVLLASCYNLADRGLLRFQNERSRNVSFGSPTILHELVNDATALTVEEIVALRTASRAPGDSADMAGNVALRLISMRAAAQSAEPLFGFRVGPSSATADAPVDDFRVGTVPAVEPPADAIVHRVWKEVYVAPGQSAPGDALGADGVVLVPGESNRFHAFRIQLQLWSGELTAANAGEIVRKFSSMSATAASAYAAAGAPLSQQTWILATTAAVAPPAREVLSNSAVTLWDKQWLAAHVWPGNVKAIHERFR